MVKVRPRRKLLRLRLPSFLKEEKLPSPLKDTSGEQFGDASPCRATDDGSGTSRAKQTAIVGEDALGTTMFSAALALMPSGGTCATCFPPRVVACNLFQRTSNSSSCNSPSPFASTWLMRLWISSSDTCELPPLMSADLSSLAEIVPLPSWSSTPKASLCDMLGRRPDSFEKPKLAKKPFMNLT